jgi:predicted DCC family thiol-disulfide oxidoreductase YuxK
MNNPKTILFDSDCLMCNSFIQFAYKLNSQYKFSNLKSEYSRSITYKNNLSNIDSIFFVIGDSVYFYSTAIIKILLNSNNLFYKMIAVLFWLIPYPIRDTAYKLVAKKRLQISNQFENSFCDINISKQIIN